MDEIVQQHIMNREYDKVIELVQKEIALADNEDYNLYHYLAVAFIENKELDRAKRVIDYLSQKDYVDAEKMNIFGVYYSRIHDFETAHKYFLKSLDINPHNSNTHRNIAMTYKMKNNEKLYMDHLTQSARLEPNNILTKIAIASEYYDRGQFNEAASIFEEVLEYDNLTDELYEFVNNSLLKIYYS